MGIWDERSSRCYGIVWLRELVLGLLETLTTSEHRLSIATVVDMGNSGLSVFLLNKDQTL
jgi:hypothetical protein